MSTFALVRHTRPAAQGWTSVGEVEGVPPFSGGDVELRVGGAAADGGLVCQCGCDGAGGEMGGNGGRSRCRWCGKTFAFAFIGIIIGSNTRFRQKRQNTGESTQTLLFNLIPFDGIVVYQIWVGYGYLLVGYLTLFISHLVRGAVAGGQVLGERRQEERGRRMGKQTLFDSLLTKHSNVSPHRGHNTANHSVVLHISIHQVQRQDRSGGTLVHVLLLLLLLLLLLSICDIWI